ncbi:MAG TPA: LPS assembly protein LptD [Candidatus Polarisedimenticolia bacterium]|jgi:hypothetical protein
MTLTGPRGSPGPAVLLFAALAAAAGLGGRASADDAGPLKPSAGERPVISATRIEQVAEGELMLTGDVDLRYGELRLLADKLHYNDITHMASAEGNVVLMFGKSEISGDRLEMNVETRLATVWNAHGYMDPDVIFQAEKLERIADDKVVITDATVTTCTQPTPYWAFHVSSATLHLDHYAYMRNAAFKTGKVPVIYMPYLIWPMKKDRSTGILLPNIGYSRRRGSFIGNALYVVLGRSQDATFYFDRYGRTGTGLGFEYRFVPADRGEGSFTGYHLDDTAPDPNMPTEELRRKRYRFKFVENQKFANGYSLLAEINKVSDLDYYLDFERDITQTTSPTVFSHVDVVRNWDNFSLNVRADRQEQFLSTVSDVTLQRLPELELRGRGIRFGHSPFYFSFETSGGVYNKDRRFEADGPERREVTYNRLDLFPTISASFTPTPWLDISPSVSARETFYSESAVDPADPNTLLSSKNVTREFASFNLSVVGPRIYRLFGDSREAGATIFKHTFEPRVSYSYIPEVSGGEHVIPFDDVDVLPGDVHRVTYSLTSRLFMKRPPKTAPAPKVATEEPFASDITGPTQAQTPVTDVKDLPGEIRQALKDETRAPGVGAVEIATFDLSQSYSLDDQKPLSRSTPTEPEAILGEPINSPAGDVVATVRFNPSPAASLDVRAAYDVLYDDIRTVSLSANFRSVKRGYARFSYFLNRDLGGTLFEPDPDPDPNTPCDRLVVDPNNRCERRFVDSSQIRLIGGTGFLNRKVTLDVEGSYDIQNGILRDQRYRFGYNTQCCGMLIEVARRDFERIDEIEYRFVLNLRGVGTFLDLQGRPR